MTLLVTVALALLAPTAPAAVGARHPLVPNPVRSNLLCIHTHEGAWNAETGNGYHGGLQMDSSFEAAYGYPYLRAWGHASRWPVWAQLYAGYRAWRTRGYTPWPNTARACGLL